MARVPRRYDIVDAIIAAAYGLRFREAWYANYAEAEHEDWLPITPYVDPSFDPTQDYAAFAFAWQDYGDETMPPAEYRLHTDGLCYFRGVIDGHTTAGPWLDHPVINLPGRIAPQSLAYTWASAWTIDTDAKVYRVMLSTVTAGGTTTLLVRTDDNIASGERIIIPLNGLSFPFDQDVY